MTTFKKVFSANWATPAAILTFLILLWIGSMTMPRFIFPSLGGIFEALWEVLTQRYDPLFTTLVRYIVALGAAIIVGWAIGLLMGAFRQYFGAYMRQVTAIIQAIPALSWVLLAVLWLENIEVRIFATTFLIALPFFVIAVYEGVRDMDKDILEAVDQFRPSKWQVLRVLLIPQSFVTLIMSVRSTAAMTLKLLVFFELIGASNGVGQQFSEAQTTYRVDLILAWTIVLVIINFIILRIIDAVEHRVLSWRTEAVVR
ncbi:ABC transporter permease [Dietzia cinnamea]|uniref:ABC transporter permease n=1 Tax=Dietzia cinnamea TaxID=321318 RepID=UPI0021AE9D2E|nr:ABC transporter permease subunit [Dietzia cinnamea]MCT2061426.1 ABC transporter permease subunit [Dietzia cinnamea]MCT2236408.1 ABC transporter permease subunit [Dietzia cinnamea]MCT2300119.1 ABC transporter permease subunit [Dietzia cinnamea]